MSLPIQLRSPLIQQGTRLPLIDQLKGFAILMVLIYHGSGMLGMANVTQGQLGVDIFVFLSGFTLALGSTQTSAKEFLTRRFFRIFPTYWCALGLFVFLAYWVHDIRPPLGNLTLHILGLHTFGNDIVFFSWAESFWFIGLIVPLYLLVLCLRRWLDRLDILLGVAGITTVGMTLYYHWQKNPAGIGHLPLRIPMFFLGLASARLLSGRRMEFRFSLWLLFGGYGIYHALFQMEQSLTPGIAGIGLMLAWLGLQPTLSKVAPGRWFLASFAFLGSISYEIYLFHQPLMRDYNRYVLIRKLGLPEPLTKLQTFIGMLVVLGGIITLAALWHRLLNTLKGRRMKANTSRPVAELAVTK